MPKARLIETRFGTLHQRSATFLRAIEYPSGTSTMVLSGRFYGSGCRPVPLSGWFRYRLCFEGIVAQQVLELDSWLGFLDHEGYQKSSLYELVDSTWLADLRRPEHRHFVFRSYDEAFELLATTCAIELWRPLPRRLEEASDDEVHDG